MGKRKKKGENERKNTKNTKRVKINRIYNGKRKENEKLNNDRIQPNLKKKKKTFAKK